MKRHFNSQGFCITGLYWHQALTGVFILTIGTCSLVSGNSVKAQQSSQNVSPAVALKASQRAEKFMRDIAVLSPMPPKTDAIHRQAWPRPLDADLSAEERVTAVNPRVTAAADILNEPILNGPNWLVRLQGRGGIDVTINEKGAVASFFDWQLMHTLGTEAPSEEDQLILPETAAARALKYLAAMGINTNEYVLTSVQFFSNTVPASARSQEWSVEFNRVWQGIPYLNHMAMLKLDAAQGRLMTGGVQSLAVQPPVVGRLDVSPEQALIIARRIIMPRVVELAGDADVELRVVLPTHFWTSEGRDYSPSTGQSRLAWRVRQPVTVQRGIVRILEAWVDTLTGEVLGGNDVGSRGPVKIGPLGGSIGKTLRAARSLQATPIASPTAKPADRQNINKTLSLELSKNKLRFYSVVAGLIGPLLPSTSPQKPPASTLTFKPTNRLIATLADGKTAAYLYDAATGLLATQDGLAGEVVQAGAGMRAWLAPAVPASTPPKNKQAAR